MSGPGYDVDPDKLNKVSDGALEDMVQHHISMKNKLQEVDDLLTEAFAGAVFGMGREFGNSIGGIRDSEDALAKSLAAFQEKIRGAARKYRLMESEAAADASDVWRNRGDGPRDG